MHLENHQFLTGNQSKLPGGANTAPSAVLFGRSYEFWAKFDQLDTSFIDALMIICLHIILLGINLKGDFLAFICILFTFGLIKKYTHWGRS